LWNKQLKNLLCGTIGGGVPGGVCGPSLFKSSEKVATCKLTMSRNNQSSPIFI